MPGRGKSGSARTLLATNRASRWFLVFGFEKNERANVTDKEIADFQFAARRSTAKRSKSGFRSVSSNPDQRWLMASCKRRPRLSNGADRRSTTSSAPVSPVMLMFKT